MEMMFDWAIIKDRIERFLLGRLPRKSTPESLKPFLRDWLEWACSENPTTRYSRSYGLCAALHNWFGYEKIEGAEKDKYILELRALLENDYGCWVSPFHRWDTHDRHNEIRNKTGHLNPKRRAWVRLRLKG